MLRSEQDLDKLQKPLTSAKGNQFIGGVAYQGLQVCVGVFHGSCELPSLGRKSQGLH